MKYNLRNICIMANRLTKEVSKSEAFKKAWLAAKQGIIEKVFGVTYGGRQDLLQQNTVIRNLFVNFCSFGLVTYCECTDNGFLSSA